MAGVADTCVPCLQAVTDAPTALFPEELIEAYPDAKVVLNVRDAEKWTKSVMDNFLVSTLLLPEVSIRSQIRNCWIQNGLRVESR